MKHLLLLPVALLLACASCASAGSPVDVRARILQLDAEWSEAAQGRDVDRIVSYWADDATVLPPGSPPVVGKPAIREFVAKSFQTPGFRISWKTNDVVVSASGDFAYATGTTTASNSYRGNRMEGSARGGLGELDGEPRCVSDSCRAV